MVRPIALATSHYTTRKIVTLALGPVSYLFLSSSLQHG